MGTQVPIPVQSSPNREKAMKESKLAILLLCLGCFLLINKVHGDCQRSFLFHSYDYGYISGFYRKTGQTSRGRPVWKINKFYKNKWYEYCIWMAKYNYWWVGPCSEVGRSSGIAYLTNGTPCPNPKPMQNQVKHVEHQAVEKLRYGDEETGVMKSSVG